MQLNEISSEIISSAIRVHKELGPGLLETAYEACLAYELTESGLKIERQKAMPLRYRGLQMDCGYRLDMLVEGLVIVELKAIERIDAIHKAQILSYLRLADLRLGLLLNFNVKLMKYGIHRIANHMPE